ncbi:unnamed protein product, partial [Protopolystoma xenopodis]
LSISKPIRQTIPRARIFSLRVSCLNQALHLTGRIISLYASIPTFIAARLFGPISEILRKVILKWPKSLADAACRLVIKPLDEWISCDSNAAALGKFIAPAPLQMENRLSVLSSLHNGDSAYSAVLCSSQPTVALQERRKLRQLGVLEQLEPNFEERWAYFADGREFLNLVQIVSSPK